MTSKHRHSAVIVVAAIGMAICVTVLIWANRQDQPGQFDPAYSRTVAEDSPTIQHDSTLELKTAPPTLTDIVVCQTTIKLDLDETGGTLSKTMFADWFVLKQDRKLYDAIVIVEGDDGEVGPAGERGAYRITPGYWRDSTEQIAKTYGASLEAVETTLDYETCVEMPLACEIIMKHYWQRYNCQTDEEKARCHNGGPRGMEKEKTLEYWYKVKNLMEANK